MYTYEELRSKIEEESILAYQDVSMLGLFPSVDIGDIGVTKWWHRKLDDIPDAALHKAGFNPNEARLNAQDYAFEVLTADESLSVDEKDWAQWSKIGADMDAVRLMGSKVGQQASYYLWRGTDSEGDSPSGEDNYFRADGSGTLASPSALETATAGAWGTYANKVEDCNVLIGQLVSKGYNIGSTVVFYPQSAYASMHNKAADERSAMEILRDNGVLSIVPAPDKYLYTQAGATPTNALFDLYGIDLTQIEIGYTRTERTRVIPPHNDVRSTEIETEVWFTPHLVPRPYDGGIYKGVSRITAIAQ